MVVPKGHFVAASNEANVSQHDSNVWLFVWGVGDGAGFASMPFVILVCHPVAPLEWIQ